MRASHPELEALAALVDSGPGSDDQRDEQLDEHISSCAQCQADLHALRSVRTTLRGLPEVSMPDDVASRLESAVRAAAAAGPVAGEPAAGANVSVLPRRSGGSGGSRGLPRFSAAAGVVVLLFVALGVGIAVIATKGGGGGSGSGAHTTAAGGSMEVSGVILASGTPYEQATIRQQVAALVVAKVAGSASKYTGLAPLAREALSAAPASAPLAAQDSKAAAGKDFSTSTGRAGADSALRPSTPVPAPTAPQGPLAASSALQACITTLNGGTPVQPVLVDYATFDGKPATIIVLPSTIAASKLAVWVEADTGDCVKNGDTAYYGSLSAS